MPLWEDGRWHLWMPGPQGLFEMHPASAIETDYVATSAESPSDIVIPFVELMWQRASWPEVCPLITSISSDFHNLGTSVEKTSLFFANRQVLGHRSTHFVKTELEYMFMLSRSVFDLLQEVIERLWSKRVQLLDPAAEARRKARKLPSTFSKMVLREKRELRTADELVAAHEFPETLAQAYISAAPFFAAVREFRDSIVHSGKDVRLLYATERGFCIQKNHPGLDRFSCWKPEHDDNENITSLLPLIAHLVLGTIETCNNLMQAFASQITLPEPLAPGHRVFIRGPHNDALLWMWSVSDGGSPWWSEREPSGVA
jgi:hypothetical protein